MEREREGGGRWRERGGIERGREGRGERERERDRESEGERTVKGKWERKVSIQTGYKTYMEKCTW